LKNNMVLFSTLMKKISSRRLLLSQLLFTALAFTAMVSISFFYMSRIVHNNLVNNAGSVYSFALTQLESNLNEPKMMLSGFSQSVRNMILRGSSIEDVQNYINDIADYFKSGESRILSSLVLFGYFEAFGDPVIITSSGSLSKDVVPQEEIWYITAVENCGVVMETPLYDSVISGGKVFTYTRCIHDDNDVRLGILGLNVSLENIGRGVAEISLGKGGYGMLLSQDLTVITHENRAFIGTHVTNPSLPASAFTEAFLAGKEIDESRLINWKGENSVAFFRKMSNGWYLGLIASEGPFYQDVKNMAFLLILLGATFALILSAILIRIDMARIRSETGNKHKSVFLANMSHEIRTPMNAIIGMTTIGKSSADMERKNQCFDKIENASNHLLGVINDILDMSKIEANKFEISPSEFCFEKMLQRVVNVVNFRADEKQQKFTVHIDQSIPKNLIGDELRIAQVITNLLGNAVKFTPEEGSIHLDARLIEEKNDICMVQISVSDTGIGILKDQQERVFSSFEQAELSTTRKYGGTGLGLPISKNIVEMMNGKIWVVSEHGFGSTFTFQLPLKKGVQPYKGLLSPDVNINNVRIMAVDDDKNILDYFLEISHEFNVQCDTAICGEDAIRLIEKNGHYHIYFVDWKMPGMDGIQLASELKAHNESLNSVVIMITSAEWTAIEHMARSAGVDKFLSKPLFPSHIADVINEILGINQKQIEEANVNINGLFKGKCILLVEDVEINREIVKALLEPTEIVIDCAENGLEAVRIFNESHEKYDMIFMDVQMPEMDGYEATRRIRALGYQKAKSIRIIAMTANVFKEDIEKCLSAGMDNHVGKPLDFDEVIQKLRHYLLAVN